MGETTSILEKVVLVYGSLMSLIALGIMLAIIALGAGATGWELLGWIVIAIPLFLLAILFLVAGILEACGAYGCKTAGMRCRGGMLWAAVGLRGGQLLLALGLVAIVVAAAAESAANDARYAEYEDRLTRWCEPAEGELCPPAPPMPPYPSWPPNPPSPSPHPPGLAPAPPPYWPGYESWPPNPPAPSPHPPGLAPAPPPHYPEYYYPDGSPRVNPAIFFLPIPPVLSVLSIAGIVLDAILAARFCKRGAADRVAADGIPMA